MWITKIHDTLCREEWGVTVAVLWDEKKHQGVRETILRISDVKGCWSR